MKEMVINNMSKVIFDSIEPYFSNKFIVWKILIRFDIFSGIMDPKVIVSYYRIEVIYWATPNSIDNLHPISSCLNTHTLRENVAHRDEQSF